MQVGICSESLSQGWELRSGLDLESDSEAQHDCAIPCLPRMSLHRHRGSQTAVPGLLARAQPAARLVGAAEEVRRAAAVWSLSPTLSVPPCTAAPANLASQGSSLSFSPFPRDAYSLP